MLIITVKLNANQITLNNIDRREYLGYKANYDEKLYCKTFFKMGWW